MYYNDLIDYCEQIGIPSGRVSLHELFSKQFMHEYTRLPSFASLQYTLRAKIKTLDDVMGLDDVEIDDKVAENTEFSTWREMFKTACDYFIAQNIK